MHWLSNELALRALRRGAIGAVALAALTTASAQIAHAALPGRPAALQVATVPRVAVRDLGPMSSTTPVHVSIALKYRNPAALEAFIEAVADPGSAQYGHYLTPSAFEANFAATTADHNRLVAALLAAGFTIDTSPTRSLVRAFAPAAVVQKFFGTKIDAVQQAGVRGLRYHNVAPATVPASIQGVTFGVTGLDDLINVKTAHQFGKRGQNGLHANASLYGEPLLGPDYGLSPYALANAYSLPVEYAPPGGGNGVTYDGSGHAAAIVIDYGLSEPGDLAGFLNYFEITQTGPPLQTVNVDGGPAGNYLDALETNLDVQTIASLAPGAATYLYLIPELSDQAIIDAYSQIVADNKVDAVNSSFGGCELLSNLGQLADHVAIQGAAEGITFSASSGDEGSSGCIFVTSNYLGVSAPASAPHFTSVGGTSLLLSGSTGAYRVETAWFEGGGGVSQLFAEPSYQQGITTAITSGRNVPDIAFDGDPGSGVSYYLDGKFQGPIGGTSLSSPIFVAYLTERNEISGKRSGFVNPALYKQWKASGYGTYFRDITIGNNFLAGPNQNLVPGYFAGPGYDDTTGLGSIIGYP